MKTVLTVLALAAMAPAALAQAAAGDLDNRKQEILNKLNSTRITLDFKDATLDEALSYIRDFTGINIVIAAEVTQQLSPEDLRISLRVKDLTLKSALKLMLSARGLTATYKEGVLVVVPRDSVDRAVNLQLYDVRDLMVQLRDFPGPKVELVSPQAGGGPLTGATFTLDEPKQTITEDFLVEMVTANTGDRSWDENPNASINLQNGILIVSQSKRVHAEVKRLINLLRQFQ